MNLHLKGYGCLTATISLFLFLISLKPAYSETPVPPGNPYLAALLNEVEERRLYNDRYWQILLHYKRTLTGSKSLIDDPRFFLSQEGQTDPRREIEETLSAFFQDDHLDDTHPICRFPARYEWLKDVMKIDASKLPVVSCAEFLQANEKIRPKKAVLVFPTAYSNNPASVFGHTLIRIDSDYQSKLLSYAANYAAAADDKNGFLYAYKGIFGYYRGYFTILPYYEKIKEYNDLEQRDIWEYRLNLTEEEVSRMLLHLWELKDIYSYYYFFDENCSYTLLFMLEAARPSLHLTDKKALWVIPIDTVRAVRDVGLIESVDYRPSRGTKIRHMAALLDKKGREVALKVADQGILEAEDGDIEKDQRIMALDIATELVQSRYNDRELDKDEYQKRFLGILKKRSLLGKLAEGGYNIEEPERPDNGHGSSRIGLGLGSSDDEPFQEIRFRAAQHEFSDPDRGFVEGSEIVFFSVSARNYPGDGGVKLESLDIIDVVSISPRDSFFKPVSWRVTTGLARSPMHDGDDGLVYRLNPGGGLAYKNQLVGLCYLMLESDLNIGNDYEHGYSLGIGPAVGVIRGISNYWKINLNARTMFYRLGDPHEGYAGTMENVFRLSRNNSLNLELSWEREFDHEEVETKLGWNIYF